jgi:hypothetical protein
MEKVVHLFEIFKSIFYSKFLDLKKVKFGLVKFWKSLNISEPFEFGKWGDCSRGPPVSPHLSPVLRQPSDMAAPRHPPAPFGRGRTPPRSFPAAWCHPADLTPTSVPPFSPHPILFFNDCASTPPLSAQPPVHSGSPELPRAHRIWPQRHHRLELPVSSARAAIVSHWRPRLTFPFPSSSYRTACTTSPATRASLPPQNAATHRCHRPPHHRPTASVSSHLYDLARWVGCLAVVLTAPTSSSGNSR